MSTFNMTFLYIKSSKLEHWIRTLPADHESNLVGDLSPMCCIAKVRIVSYRRYWWK